MTRALAALLFLWLQGPPPPAAQPPAGGESDVVRARVQQYFDTQAKKDPDAALAFWSATARSPEPQAWLTVYAGTS